ncbi:MAG: hypothetical protein HYV08_02540 [Deltaproteobacteria bacterium]|nr:hypothetical protein [Deltaproteobacteria bacterium]
MAELVHEQDGEERGREGDPPVELGGLADGVHARLQGPRPDRGRHRGQEQEDVDPRLAYDTSPRKPN